MHALNGFDELIGKPRRDHTIHIAVSSAIAVDEVMINGQAVLRIDLVGGGERVVVHDIKADRFLAEFVAQPYAPAGMDV